MTNDPTYTLVWMRLREDRARAQLVHRHPRKPRRRWWLVERPSTGQAQV
jgi:hypothetical protein